MGDFLYFLIVGSIVWIVYAKATKRSIIPWKETEATKDAKLGFKSTMKKRKAKKKSKKKAEEEVYVEEEPDFFEELVDEIVDINGHLLHLKDNTFMMFCEARPCNYFLRSEQEQEAIDANFESWLATLNYDIRVYLQSRYIDISEPIEEMRDTMIKQNDLPPNAIEYGKSLINDLEKWQMAAPRYEIKRYLMFPFKVSVSSLAGTAENDDELNEKIQEKAFSELYRRFNAAKNILNKSYMDLDLLTTEGITEVLYYAFNRRKALKTKFKNVKDKEMLANYLTSDQSTRHVEIVKEMIKENEKIIQKEEAK